MWTPLTATPSNVARPAAAASTTSIVVESLSIFAVNEVGIVSLITLLILKICQSHRNFRRDLVAFQTF